MFDDGDTQSTIKPKFDVICLYLKAVKFKLAKLFVYHLEEMSPTQVILTKAKVIFKTPTEKHEPTKISLMRGIFNSISDHLKAGKGFLYPTEDFRVEQIRTIAATSSIYLLDLDIV